LGIWKVKRGKRPLNFSHESIERAHTYKHSLKREQIEEEQEEDHFQKRGAQISMQRQIPAINDSHITSPYSTVFCTEIEVNYARKSRQSYNFN
jgi:hypothetical protein